jgi:DNA repair protein RadD
MMMNLYPHQADTVEKILDYEAKHPHGRLLVVGPPGVGKTLITAITLRRLAFERDLPGLVVAHRREMINHHYEHLVRCDIDPSMLGIIMGNDRRTNPRALIQIASIDTLNRRDKPDAKVIFTDEAHRDASRSRRKLRKLYPEAFRVGITATPTRLDSKGLAEDFDDMILVSSMSELIAGRYLSAPRIFTVPDELLPDISQVRTRAGEYDANDLNKAVNRRALVGGLVEHWLRRADNRRTVTFAASIEHSKYIAEQFTSAGIASAHLDQEASDMERLEMLSKLKSGDLRMISCVNILAEGWDCLPCKCVILARPTKSLTLHIQQSTRCMRPWEAVVPLILDHAGNMIRHRILPHVDRQWSLDPEKATGQGEAPVKACSSCDAIVAAGFHECPSCGHPFDHAPPILEELEGTLVEYKMTESAKRREMSRLRKFALERGFADADGWARRVYQATYREPASPTA